MTDGPIQSGVALITAERERQITEEGYGPEHDSGHGEELTVAALSYAIAAHATLRGEFTPEQAEAAGIKEVIPPFWPWSSHYWKPTGDPVRDLVKAGALIAAAIDALQADA